MAQRDGQVETAVEWTSYPLARHPVRGAILIAICILFCVGTWMWFEHWVFVSVAVAVLFLSTMRYYFPTRYRLDGEGVRSWFIGLAKFRPWSDFRNVYVHKDGMFLAPFEKPSRLDAFRGIYIRFGANRDEAVAFAKEQTASPEQADASLKSGVAEGEAAEHV